MAGSNFYIFQSEYDAGKKEYHRFLVREKLGEHLGPYIHVTRQQVISAMEAGLSFELFKLCSQVSPKRTKQNSNQLYLIKVDGQPYLRTDKQEIPADM